MRLARLAALLAGLWAGVLLCIASIAAPSTFAMLASVDAGRVVGRMFAREAVVSLCAALLLIVLERRRGHDSAPGTSVFNANLILLLGTLSCTVAGYYAVQPLLAVARAGQGSMSFGALHAVSLGFFTLKGLLVLALAWRLGRN